MNFLSLILLTLTFTVIGSAQEQNQLRTQDNRPRVFIEESESWEIESDPIFGSVGKKGTIISGGETKGGAKPRTAEIMKRFSEQCKGCVVTMYKEKADFVILLEHEGGKDIFNKDNKLAVFNKEGDMIASGSFSRLRKAVETACVAITQEFVSSVRPVK